MFFTPFTPLSSLTWHWKIPHCSIKKNTSSNGGHFILVIVKTWGKEPSGVIVNPNKALLTGGIPSKVPYIWTVWFPHEMGNDPWSLASLNKALYKPLFLMGNTLGGWGAYPHTLPIVIAQWKEMHLPCWNFPISVMHDGGSVPVPFSESPNFCTNFCYLFILFLQSS